MSDTWNDATSIPLGTPVIAFDGTPLGEVREAHRHYLLVGEKSQHGALEVPVHAILGMKDGRLQVSVNRRAVSEVDDEETAHRLGQE